LTRRQVSEPWRLACILKSWPRQLTPENRPRKQRRAAAERLRGMFAHVAPGVSLADELIAVRRAEARAEAQADARRRADD
jgi:hypothetical protein